MFPILSSQQMRELDQQTSGKQGGMVFMRRAGEALASKVGELLDTGKWEHTSSLRTPPRRILHAGWQQKPVLILAGHGNNGGDGIVLAELLEKAKRAYTLVLFRSASELKAEAAEAYKLFESLGGNTTLITTEDALTTLLAQAGLVVDAMLGLGAEGALRGIIAQAVSCVRASGNPVLAVDCPTGTRCDLKEPMPEKNLILQADWTLILGYPRYEAFFESCGHAFGQWTVAPLGYKDPAEKTLFCDRKDIAAMVPARSAWVDKRKQGIVGVVAGSRGMTGAATLCATAAMRSGAGMVFLAAPTTEIQVLATKLTEVVLQSMDSANGTLVLDALPSILAMLSKSHAGCVGPGLSVQEETQKLVRQLILDTTCPLVLDADGLNAFKGYSAMLRGLKHPPVLTPHDGEWERLFRKLPGEGLDRISALREKCTEFRCVIVLKGAPTLVGTPDGEVFLVPVANSGLAKAGSGDLLAGIIASFLAQGTTPVTSALMGTWIHARAGMLAVEQFGQRGALPSDVVQQIPFAILELEKESCTS